MPSSPRLTANSSRHGRTQRAVLGLLAAVTLLLTVSGCGRVEQGVRQSMDNNPQMRQSAIDNARRSCVQTATAKAPKLPGLDAKINNYCDCFATKGLGKFSNSELASIALHSGHFTPEQETKLMQGVQLCQGELRGAKR